VTGLDRIRFHALVLNLMLGLHRFPIYLDVVHRIILDKILCSVYTEYPVHFDRSHYIIVDSTATLIHIYNNNHTFANSWI